MWKIYIRPSTSQIVQMFYSSLSLVYFLRPVFHFTILPNQLSHLAMQEWEFFNAKAHEVNPSSTNPTDCQETMRAPGLKTHLNVTEFYTYHG